VRDAERSALKGDHMTRSLLLVRGMTAVLAGAVAAPASGQQLEEVVVTARKREESMQSVPVAVTALTSADFARQNVVSLQDLNLGIPNVTITQNTGLPGGAQVYIRGIGQDDSTFTSEQGVGMYVDGVYIGKQNGAMLDLIDFEQVEVLRGPQGTLYGKNSPAGAIKFVARRPDLDSPRFLADVTTGSRSRFDVRASASLPVIEGVLALKADAYHRQNDGFMKDVSTTQPRVDLNNLDRTGGRLAGLWKPAERWTVYGAVDYLEDRSNIFVPTSIVTVNGEFLPRYGDVYAGTHGIPNIYGLDRLGSVVEVAYDFGPATLKSLTGYRSIKEDLAQDADGNELVIGVDFIQYLRYHQFSQEFQVTSNGGGRVQYSAGLYYFSDVARMDAQNFFQRTNNFNRQESKSYAVYGEVSYALTEAVRLAVGGRYTRDEKDMTYNRAVSQTTGALLFDAPASPSWSDFSPRVTVDWQATNDVLLYASYSQGYKAGGFISGRPGSLAQALAVFDPEQVSAYEVGAKSEFLDRRLRANAALFYNDYTDMQLSYFANGQFNVVTADVEVRGAELETAFAPVDGLTLTANVSLLRNKYVSIPLLPTGLPVSGITRNTLLKNAPRSSYRLGVNYDVQAAGGLMQWSAAYTHNSKIYHNTQNSELTATPPVGVLDAQVGYAFAGDRWRVAVGGRNLTDERYWLHGFNPFSRFYAEPRTWYATASVSW
jgi:iron complex outermembrane receptor protein